VVEADASFSPVGADRRLGQPEHATKVQYRTELYIGRLRAVTRRPSRQTLAVLGALAADAARWRYGYELGQEVELKAGSLYPILMRLGDRGLLESAWETDAPPGRPPRHLYRLTAAGLAAAADAQPAPARALRPARGLA
jgi:DNA-binding PadR family transcriptional regulator